MKRPESRYRLNLLVLCLGALGLAALSACQGSDAGPGTGPGLSRLPDTSASDPANPASPAPPHATDVLLFNGTGVSTSDWQSTEQILLSQGLSYQLANSAQLNAMTAADLRNFGAMVVPGGSGGSIAGAITSDAQLRVRKAVQDDGMGYVGFCAGAWVAVGPEATSDQVAAYGLALAPGDVLPAFYPGGNSSLTAAVVPVTFPDGSHRQLVWWGGPSTPEWSQGVVARYDTGVPAISETFSGKGLVIVSGPHPEAPQGWRATAGTDSDGLDFDLAIALIRAAVSRQKLAAY